MGPVVLAKAKEYVNTLQSGQQMMKGIVDYPAASSNPDSDVIRCVLHRWISVVVLDSLFGCFLTLDFFFLSLKSL
jgi:hypothetical protein